MARKKYKKIIEVYSFKNVFDREKGDTEIELRTYFQNQNPITLEIGCGHGDYSIELARIYPERNFVGIDIKGARIYTGAKLALDSNLSNAAFLLTGAERLTEVFINEKIEEIYIPFPDPHYKRKSIKKRLISPEFLSIYKSILKDEGRIHLKTDNDAFYNYAIETIKENKWKIYYSTSDLYNAEPPEILHNILTKYEKHYLEESKEIKYICFVI